MSIDSKHPDYLEVADDYRTTRDTFGGQRVIKEANFLYLSATMGQIKDGAARSTTSAGYVSYTNYLARAVFPEFVREAVNALVGVMHAEPPIIELPEALEPMRKNATRKGESLDMLLRRINEQQLLFGRYGLLADFPQNSFLAEQAEAPHLVGYQAETIINWDDERFTEFSQNELSFAVFNETANVRGADAVSAYEWSQEQRFRVVQLEPLNPEDEFSADNPLVYKTFTQEDSEQSDVVIPAFRGQTLDEIPFVVIGANDLDLTPDEIPLLGLANLSLAIYRGEADYRQALHMQGQDTLVIIGEEAGKDGDSKGEEEPTEVGAGAVIHIIAGEGAGAKFIGVESKGLPEQKSALENDKGRAQSMGARLLEPRGTQAESGEALRIRVAASTASMATLAHTGANGLEAILRVCAKWIGADPDQVKVRPNMDFTQETPSPELARELGEALKTGKIPLSAQAVHKWLQAKNFTKFTYDQEMELLRAEEAKDAALAQVEKLVGRTDERKGHSHSYMLFRFPDGSVSGTTDIMEDHFHPVNEEGVTDLANKHLHGLLEAVPVQDLSPAEEEEEPPDDEGSDDQE